MANLSFSPTLSISSHTLSAQSNQPPTSDSSSSAPQSLISALSAAPHTFLQPPSNLHVSALELAKHFLDPLASGVSEAQILRQKEARKKRKRGEYERGDEQVLRLKKVHLEGFGVEQVWEQARRVLEAARQEVEKALPQADGRDSSTGRASGRSGQAQAVLLGSNSDAGGAAELDDGISNDEGVGSRVNGHGGSEDEDQEDAALGSGEDAGPEGEDPSGEEPGDEGPADTYVPDPHGLNDGFFSIDDFNKQTEFLEHHDVRGEDDGAASDEEIDWGADPLASEASAGRPGPGSSSGGEESDEAEDGPTFGNMDLDAPEGASDDGVDEDDLDDGDMAGLGGVADANNILYADFFAPPPKRAAKNKQKGRPHPHNFPANHGKQGGTVAEPDGDDIERTVAAVHRDLFEDEDPLDGEDSLSDLDPADPKSRRSAHERRQAKLAEEIRRLEAANVAKRDWQLSGEARGSDRPANALLEEDLDFETTGKSVPVITQEVSEDIEAMIKRRILAREFDEVLRRRPDDLATGPGVRRGRFELDDSKASKSLAEIYEEEHLRKTDPNYVDAKDEKLMKEHREVEALWKDVCGKLDALSSWHYRPKPPAPSLEIRVDAPAISMEDARPTAGAEAAGASMLAPQEVYAPGKAREADEIVTKGGLPVKRDEMTREQKLRRRRREKERIRKANANKDPKKEGKQSKEKEMIGQLKRGGVKVIGKKGELRDVEGNAIKEGVNRVAAGSFKL